MRKTIAILALCPIALFACGGEPQDTHPGEPVAHRRAAFKEIIKVFEPMGVMLRTDRYDAKKFQALSVQFMALRDGPWSYFTADSQYPPSHASPDVWSEAAKFAAEKQAFFDASDKLAAIAGTPDQKLASDAYEAVHNTCRNCHKTFKTQ